MNKQLKYLVLVGSLILLLAACAPFNPSTSAGTPAAGLTTEDQTDPAENLEASNLVEDAPVDASDSANFSRYIGLNYPPLPGHLTESFSMLIQDTDGYGLAMLSEGENQMLWLSHLTHYDSNGNALWEVQDILDLSDVEAGHILIPDGCTLNGTPDSEIFVAVRNDTVQYAWRANTTLNQFEVLPTTGVECDSDKGILIE